MNQNKFLSRKFALSLLVILAASAMRCFDLIAGAEWLTAVGGALTVYSASDVSEKVWTKVTQ